MNKYSLLKILSYIFGAIFALAFLVSLTGATQFGHYVLEIIALLVPAFLFFKLGKWASNKEKKLKLERDPDFYEHKKQLKEQKLLEKNNLKEARKAFKRNKKASRTTNANVSEINKMNYATKDNSIDLEKLINQNHDRIARESLEIILNTKDPETFFSRYDLALQYMNSQNKKILLSSFDELCEKFLYRYDDKISTKLLSLKTEQAKNNNLNKFISEIQPFLFKLSNENKTLYDEIISKYNNFESQEPSEENFENMQEIGLIKAQERMNNSDNPKFHRTKSEEELSFNFYMNYKNKIKEYENKIFTSIDSDYIKHTVESIKAFDELQQFCFSKSKGGKLYFEDNWLNCHNSHNSCFSYRDGLVDSLYNTCEYYLELPEKNLIYFLYYSSLKVDELKKVLKENGLKISGNKSNLIDRLISNNITPVIDTNTQKDLENQENIVRVNKDYMQNNKDLINKLCDEDLIDDSLPTDINSIVDNSYKSNSPENFIQSIPMEVINLLWFKNGPFKNLSSEKTSTVNNISINLPFTEEPSVLDVYLPIKKGVDNTKIGYYPSYKDLNEIQRYQYLNWLKDITKEIDISYVFIFYYGLERYLFTEKWKDACDMIYKLQESHNNGSFNGYSSDALLITAFRKKDISILQLIDKNKIQPAAYASIKGAVTHSFDAEDIITFSKLVGWTNNRYIKSEYNLFSNELKKLINEKFSSDKYFIDANEYKTIKKSITLMLANYSLDIEDRKFEIPDILSSYKIKNDLYELLETTHNNVKEILKVRRKK